MVASLARVLPLLRLHHKAARKLRERSAPDNLTPARSRKQAAQFRRGRRDSEQPGELALAACVGLDAHGVVAGDLGQPALDVVDQGIQMHENFSDIGETSEDIHDYSDFLEENE